MLFASSVGNGTAVSSRLAITDLANAIPLPFVAPSSDSTGIKAPLGLALVVLMVPLSSCTAGASDVSTDEVFVMPCLAPTSYMLGAKELPAKDNWPYPASAAGIRGVSTSSAPP